MKLFSYWVQVAYLTIFFVLFRRATGAVRFTNFTCTELDVDFGVLEDCTIKELSSTHNMINFVFAMKKTASDGTIHAKLMKKSNGVWRTIMLDAIVDPCDFFKNPKKFYVAHLIYDFALKYTNANHTCPYKKGERIILKDFELDSKEVLSKFPIQYGEYAVSTKWMVQRKPILSVWATIKYTEK